MKFNAGNSVLLGSVLGTLEDQNDGASSKQFYNNWNDRQERFASQFNSQSQLQHLFPKPNAAQTSLPNHNNIIASNKDVFKGVSLSFHNQSSTGGSILDYHASRKKVENYYQIPTTQTVGECKICQINQSVCSICLQKQSKIQRPFLNPKGSESFSTNIPLYRQSRLYDSHNNSSINSSIRDSIKQLSFQKRNELKKQVGIDLQNQNASSYSLQVNQQEGLKFKITKPIKNKKSGILSQSLLSTLEEQKSSQLNFDKIHPSTTGKKDSERRKQYFSEHISQTNEDEKILSDNYMKYILRIRQEEVDNIQNQPQQQNFTQSDSLNQINHPDRIHFKNLLPNVLEQNSNQNKNPPNINQLNNNDIYLSSQNQMKVVDLNNLLSKQKSCSQYVNSQLVVDASQIKSKHLMNISHINFSGHKDLSTKKKLENEYYQKSVDTKVKQQEIIHTQNPILGTTQAIQAYQKSLKKPKKSIIYSKVKTQNQQTSLNQSNNANPTQKGDDQLINSPHNKTLEDRILKTTASEEIIDLLNEKSEQKFQQYLQLIGRNNNLENKSNKKLLKTCLINNEDILDEKSEVSDQLEEDYHNNQMISGQKKSIADQLSRYVRNLKKKVLKQNLNQRSDQNIHNSQGEKENKRTSLTESSEMKISSLAQKSSDQNIFNFKYRKTLLKASTNFNANLNTQSIEFNDEDPQQIASDPKEQQKHSFDTKIMNQESTTSLDALPISFPKLHRPLVKKNISINQRSDLQLNAQRINVKNRLDKQYFSSGKESFYESNSNKKQNEKQINYNLIQSKNNKLLQNSIPISSSKQIKTEPTINNTENNFKDGIQINTYVNKNRITNQDISLQDMIKQRTQIGQQFQNYESKMQIGDISTQDIDLCEWKSNPIYQSDSFDEQLLIDSNQICIDENIIKKQPKKKKQKIIKVKNINTQPKDY